MMNVRIDTWCDVCSQFQNKVIHLIEGNMNTYICKGCLKKAMKLIKEERGEDINEKDNYSNNKE